MDSGDDPVGYVMCAINAYSSVLVLPRSSWSTATHRLRPRACALLGQLAELAAASELAQLAGRCGAGVCACVCAACVRACGVCARVGLRACGVLRAGAVLARVRSRCSSRQLHFLRRAFGSGRVSDVEVREFVGVRKRKECPQVATPSEEPIPVEIYWFTKSCCLSEVKKFTYPRTTHTHT